MKNKGFSLVELLVVVAIIGILSTILVPNVREYLSRAKVVKTKALISSLEVTIEAYKNDFGKYPDSYNPQELYTALMNSKTSYEPGADETRFFEQGTQFWINPERPSDDRRVDILSSSGVPANAMVASEDENVFIDAWGNPIYYISSSIYNPSGRRSLNRNTLIDNAPCAYEMRDGDRYRPFNPTSFQLVSFGPDGSTITPSQNNGGIGSMIATDKEDNDGDGLIDNLDRPDVININDNDPEYLAEDDITNFM